MLPINIDNLIFTEHAQTQMIRRGIAWHSVAAVIIHGKPRPGRDNATVIEAFDIAVVINCAKVITVYQINNCHRVRHSESENPRPKWFRGKKVNDRRTQKYINEAWQ